MENTSVISLDRRWSRTNFDLTPIMSTYILAFIVCDFKPITTVGPNNLKVNFKKFNFSLNKSIILTMI